MLRRTSTCEFQKVNVSGDGPNNEGFEPYLTCVEFQFDEVTVNGLVSDVPGDIAEREARGELVDYYTRQVIHDPPTFVENADGYEDFVRTID